MATSEDIYRYKIVSIGSLLLSLYGNIHFLISYGSLSEEISITPFSNFLIFIIIYWVVYYLVQVVYLERNLNLAIDNSESNVLSITKSLIYFNILTLIWATLFKNRFYVISELVLIVEFFMLLTTYLNNKLYSFRPVSTYLVINLTAGSLPLSWTFFTIFWNGAVMVRASGLAARVVANVFIWEFLLFGLAFLVLFNDYTVGLSTAFLVLGLALNQLFTKLIALQWIFAFIISGLLFVSSLAVIAFKKPLNEETLVVETTPQSEQTNLLSA